MDMEIMVKKTLFFTFISIYILTAFGTLSMLFLGWGAVRDQERTLLINTFLVETAVSIISLFYSVWDVKKKEKQVSDQSEKFIINPLDSSFVNKIIPMDALRLPTIQLHENKHFKGCKFIGPSALIIMGGTYNKNNFMECGDFIAMPENIYFTGIIAFKNCTVEECEFIHISILCEPKTARKFLDNGIPVKGAIS